jgi:hypothetical protein
MSSKTAILFTFLISKGQQTSPVPYSKDTANLPIQQRDNLDNPIPYLSNQQKDSQLPNLLN